MDNTHIDLQSAVQRVQKRTLCSTVFPLIVSLFLVSALAFFGVSCSRQDEDRGVLRSDDAGLTWTQKSAIDDRKSIAGERIVTLTVSPFDNAHVVAGTAESGLWMSLNRGESWQQSSIGEGVYVSAVAFSTKTPGLLYAGGLLGAVGKLYRSDDAGATWQEVFSAAEPNQRITSILVDWYNDTTVYAGLYDGTLLKSKDGGTNWFVNIRFPSAIQQIAASWRDSRLLYVATRTSGVWYTTTGGELVTSLQDVAVGEPAEGMFWANIEFPREFSGTDRIFSIFPHPTYTQIVYVGSKFGLIRSEDEGQTWEEVPILGARGSYQELLLVGDPLSIRKLYAVDRSSLYISNDYGQTWKSQRITTQNIRSFAIDSNDPQTLYIGVEEAE